MTMLTLNLEHRQHQVLTPRLQQAVRLLQISTLDFHQELRQLLSMNPFLDLIDEESSSPLEDIPKQEEAEEPIAVDKMETAPTEEGLEPFADNTPWGEGRNGREGAEDRLALAQAEISLRDHLHQQLHVLRLSERECLISALVVEGLDDDGYLRMSLEDLRTLLELTPLPSMSEMQFALKLVQSFDPPGVGCRDVRECLRLQLKSQSEENAKRKIALHIIEHEFERLIRHDFTGLALRLGQTAEQIEGACQLIRQLMPKPCGQFGRHTVCCLIPDVFVQKKNARWQAQLNAAAIPKMSVNQSYAELFRRYRQSHHGDMAASLHEARWTIRNIEQRFHTILQVAQAIVARQQLFFEYGPLHMQPLGLRDIAASLGLHESTISRATNNKYMATPAGIFELKYFFSRGLNTLHGHPCSTTAIRGAIRQMIRDEDHKTPLSDAAITQRLQQQGLKVARRTVTKYRQTMNIPAMESRRHRASFT